MPLTDPFTDPFTELEDALVTAAEADPTVAENARVFAWADDSQGGKVGLKGGLKVRFIDQQSDPPSAPSRTFLQEDATVFECRLGVKSLRGHAGAYPVVWALRQAVSGLLPTLATANQVAIKLPGFYHVETGVVGYDEAHGVWVFAVMFAINLIYRES